MQQEIAYSQNTNLKEALEEITSQLNTSSNLYNLVLFFASSIYDFQQLTSEFHRLFPHTQVIGVSSGGEIQKNGFGKRGLLVTTMSDPDTIVSTTMIESINKFPIIHKKKIETALEECNIDINEKDFHKHSFALTFINGLLNLEEYFLSMMYAIVGNPKFQLIGASAGDDYRFYKTKLSLNGKVSTDGAIVTFINTKKRFHLYKQNIFKPTGNQLHITNCDMENRVITEINGKPPLTAYAEELGVSSTTLIDTMLDHPLGRTFGSDTYITSLAGFNTDKTLNMRTRIINHSILDILEPDDTLAVSEETCQKITTDFKNPGFVFFIVCICNVISYKRHNYCDSIIDIFNQYFDHFCGFASGGEQLNQVHLSQTTLVLVMEE